MKLKFVIGLTLSLMAAALHAGEKIAPDLNNLAEEWQLSSAKVVEDDGDKYLRLETPDEGNIAGMSHRDISLQGVKRVKVSLKYRSNVYSVGLHGGSWYLVGFKLTDAETKYEGIVLSKTTEWTAITKSFDVPENARSLMLALRLQDSRDPNDFLDAKDIVIELED